VYSKYNQKKSESPAKTNKAGNHDKNWTIADEEKLQLLFHNQESFKAIARELGRGEKGVNIKLINLGLLAEDEEF